MRRALLPLGLLLASCTILGPQRDSSRFFTLTAVAESPDGAAPSGIAVGLGPVRVPAYLDRPELATRVATSEVRFSPNERWAEPLSASLRRVLAQNLATILGTDEIVAFPWAVGTPVDWGVAIDLIRFERTTNGEVKLGQYSPSIPNSMARGKPGERENMVVVARSPTARAMANCRVR